MSRLAALLVLSAAPAWAGPGDPEPRDYDDPGEQPSHFWQRAIDPDQEAYDGLVDRAVVLAGIADHASLKLAGDLLRDAAAGAPERAPAHLWLGRLAARRGDDAECARELGKAQAADPELVAAGGDYPAAWALYLELGLCKARAGQLEDAVASYRHIVNRAVADEVVFERLADALMALGRVDEALDAIDLSIQEDPYLASGHFARAVAYDRDEDTAEAAAELEIALQRDGGLTSLSPIARPYAPRADEAYYRGLALEHLGDRGRALFHFRHYLASAGESPWAERARSHARALADGGGLGDPVVQGTATLDLVKVRRALAKARPKLAACLAASPELLLDLNVTAVVGGDASATQRPGVRVLVLEQADLSSEALHQAVDCVDQIARGLALPAPKGAQATYATLGVTLIAD